MTNDNLSQKEVYKLKKYLSDHKISYADFARILRISEAVLKKYIAGTLFPNRKILEKIFIFTDGKVTPMDFLFRYEENPSDSIKEAGIKNYILNALARKVVNRKELSYQLGLTISALSKKLKGSRSFNNNELQTIMNFIEKQM